MSYFIFNGQNSQEFGILERLPLDIRAERTTQIIDMPYGTPIVYQSPAFKSQKITVNLGLKDNSAAHISRINQWLQGYHELIFSNDPDKHYMAVCNGALTGERMILDMGMMPISFTVMPFKYANVNEFEDLPINIADKDPNFNDVIIPYEGSYPAEPVFKVTASGDFKFETNNGEVKLELHDVSSEVVTIDIPNRKVYQGNNDIAHKVIVTKGSIGNMLLKNNLRVAFGKSVTKIEILKNTRWL